MSQPINSANNNLDEKDPKKLKAIEEFLLEEIDSKNSQKNIDLNHTIKVDSTEKSSTEPNYTGRSIVGQTQKNPEDFALWKFVDPNSLQKWQFSQYPKAQKILDSIYFNQLEDFNIALENGETNPDEDKYPLYPNISNLWGCPGWHSECVAMICAILGNPKAQEERDDGDFGIDDEAQSETSEEKFDFSQFIKDFQQNDLVELENLKLVFSPENLEKIFN